MTAVTATGYGDQKLLMGSWHHKMRARGCAFAHGEGSDDVAAVAQLRGSTATSVMATMEPLARSVGGGVPWGLRPNTDGNVRAADRRPTLNTTLQSMTMRVTSRAEAVPIAACLDALRRRDAARVWRQVPKDEPSRGAATAR